MYGGGGGVCTKHANRIDTPDYVCSVSRLYLRGLDNTTPVPSALPKQAGETLRRGHDEGRGGDVLAEGRVGPVAPLR